MNKNKHVLRPKGEEVVQKYLAHAGTPHGRLRHDLLFLYYDEFIKGRDIDWVLDIGGGSGLLVEKLLKKYPKLRAAVIDADDKMIKSARESLAPFLETQRAEAIVETVEKFPAVFSSLPLKDKNLMVTFNHTIEYVVDKKDSLDAIRTSLPRGSFFGIMYLNNSHEAMRKLMFKDSPEGVLAQLEDHRLDMVYFGMAEAAGTGELEHYFSENGVTQVEEYGIRCISDFKSRDFMEENYEQILRMEFALGKLSDFIGLARYRIKIFAI